MTALRSSLDFPYSASMLFASTSLAARIERAECQLMSAGAAAMARRHPEAAVYTQAIAGGLATYTLPGSPLNKLAGLGFSGPVDEDELAAVEQVFAGHETPLQVELSNLADPAIGALLTRRGYVLVGFENVLGRAFSAAPVAPVEGPGPATDGIEIASSGADELALWLDIVVSGFMVPDTEGVASHESFPRAALEQATEDMACADGFLRYLARLGDEPVGGASMRLTEGVAQLCGAATLRDHRRRGVQTALLAARLREASRAGCDVAVMTTLPGSKSHQNGQRRGFELLYTRAVLVRDA